jgi:hypothetical protein
MIKWQQDMEAEVLHGKAEVIIGKQRHGPAHHWHGRAELRAARFTRPSATVFLSWAISAINASGPGSRTAPS